MQSNCKRLRTRFICFIRRRLTQLTGEFGQKSERGYAAPQGISLPGLGPSGDFAPYGLSAPAPACSASIRPVFRKIPDNKPSIKVPLVSLDSALAKKPAPTAP